VGALKAVLEPILSLHSSAVNDLRADFNTKHEENRENRHALRNQVETHLSQINLDILSVRERVLGLEMKMQQAVGADGTTGAIQSLKDGQAAQLAATNKTDVAVGRIESTLAEIMPVIRTMKTEQEGKTYVKHERNNARDWAELILKYGALAAGAWAIIKHLH
jgi:hypothetical protein